MPCDLMEKLQDDLDKAKVSASFWKKDSKAFLDSK